jgi:hypothetical protein
VPVSLIPGPWFFGIQMPLAGLLWNGRLSPFFRYLNLRLFWTFRQRHCHARLLDIAVWIWAVAGFR